LPEGGGALLVRASVGEVGFEALGVEVDVEAGGAEAVCAGLEVEAGDDGGGGDEGDAN
jgi:hypothetical protein